MFYRAASPQKSSANSRNNFKCCRSVKLPLSGPYKHRSRFICGCALYASGKRLPFQKSPGVCWNIVTALHSLSLRPACRTDITIRGYGMLQEIHPLQKAHGHVDMELQLTALTSSPQQQYLMDIYWRTEHEYTRFNSPFTFETTFPVSALASHYMLHIGGFRQHVIFTPRIFSCHEPVRRQTPVLLTVIPHSHTGIEDPQRVALTTRMLVAHVTHHVKLGLAGTVHYEVEPFLTHLASDPSIQNLVLQGNLRLIRWDVEVQGYMPDGLVWNKNRAKTLEYNHAILAHWGLDVYINPVDIDEFMATRGPSSVAELFSEGCIVPGGHTTLLRFDIRCGTCQGAESGIWLAKSGINPLALYNETDWSIRLRGKAVIYADTSFSMAIHESGVFHDGLERHKNCVFHLHVVNLFRYRRTASDNANFKPDTSWDWSIQ